MQEVMLKRSCTSDLRRSVRDEEGTIVETMVFSPGQPVLLDERQYAAIAKDLRLGTIVHAQKDKRGKVRTAERQPDPPAPRTPEAMAAETQVGRFVLRYLEDNGFGDVAQDCRQKPQLAGGAIRTAFLADKVLSTGGAGATTDAPSDGDQTKGPAEEGVVGSQREVALHFKVTEGVVKSWRKDGMPGETGRYVLADIDAWYKATYPEPPAAGQPKTKDTANAAAE